LQPVVARQQQAREQLFDQRGIGGCLCMAQQLRQMDAFGGCIGAPALGDGGDQTDRGGDLARARLGALIGAVLIGAAEQDAQARQRGFGAGRQAHRVEATVRPQHQCGT